MTSATCLLLASISHDAGEPEAGMMQARAAETYANAAKHPELLGWVLCTKAMIDLSRRRPVDVLAHTGRGTAIALSGGAGLRLRGLRVRALAQLNRRAEAAALMRQIEHAPPAAHRPGSMANFGAVFSFPETRQLYYAAVSHAHLGDLAAVTLPPMQRINQLGQVLTDIDRRLQAPAFRGSPSATALGEAIREFHRSTPPVATTS